MRFGSIYYLSSERALSQDDGLVQLVIVGIREFINREGTSHLARDV